MQDTRLRDALRVLAGAESLSERPEFRSRALTFPRPSVVDDAFFAVEAAVVTQADEVRLRRQVDGLERRVQRLESKFGTRVQRLLERVFKRPVS